MIELYKTLTKERQQHKESLCKKKIYTNNNNATKANQVLREYFCTRKKSFHIFEEDKKKKF